jgi:hypothetical protein
MAAYVQVTLPPPPAPPAQHDAVRQKPQSANPDAAPTEAPSKIVPERAVDTPQSGFETEGAINGIPGGMPMKVESVPPPPPPSVEKVPVRPGGQIQPPRKLRMPRRSSHDCAVGASRRDGHRAIIGEDGRVQQARVYRALLDEAALTAVRQWVFHDAVEWEPVPVVMTVTVTFRISNYSPGSSR